MMTKPEYYWSELDGPIPISENLSDMSVSDWVEDKSRGEIGGALVDYAYNYARAQRYIEQLEGRIYELEQTIDGREQPATMPGFADSIARSEWAWPEKEED